MNRILAGMLCVLCGVPCGIASAQQPDLSKPKVPIVAVVGCVTRVEAQKWILTNASAETVSQTPYSSQEEIEKAKGLALGSGTYRLIGTTEFLTAEELMQDEQRKAVTKVPNTTGQLQNGHKVMVKGLLIAAPSEKRINLLSVQRLAERCP